MTIETLLPWLCLIGIAVVAIAIVWVWKTTKDAARAS